LIARETYREVLMSKANVVGLGIGYRHKGKLIVEDISLIVMVKKKIPCALLDPGDLIPAEIEGVPVDIQEMGDLERLIRPNLRNK
jgi:hypothetical protein